MRELFLVNFDGLTYGIWSDDVRAVEDLQTIHRIPLSPACIAGMSIIRDRAVTLADLSVCVGHAPITRSGKGHILFMSDQEKVTGFVIEGELKRIEIRDTVYPMPDYLKTLVIDTCVMLETRPIPVINIAVLYNCVQKTDREPLSAPLSVAASRADSLGPEMVRVFVIGNERFAVQGQGIEEKAATLGPVTKLELVPQFVSGIAFHQGGVLPVIDLQQRIKNQKSAAHDLMLIADIGGSRFGFIVQADQGTLPGGFTIKPLPPIAQSRWIRSAVVYTGEVLPLVDLRELIAAPSDEIDEKPLAQRYVPDSQFYSQFGKEEVAVLEFSLLGVRHALPKPEVENVIGFTPYRDIPGVPQIVVGVAEHDGMLLPVIDLAMVFGRRSLATPEWRMVLVRNGDFHALVITEGVFGERRLTLEVQRVVPIALPHRLVYGCYPEADAVRLVLNVESMAVHFERSMAKQLIPVLGIELEEPVVSMQVEKIREEAAAPVTENVLEQKEEQDEPVAALAGPVLEFHEAPASLEPQKTEETERIQADAVSISGEVSQSPEVSSEEPVGIITERIQSDAESISGEVRQSAEVTSEEPVGIISEERATDGYKEDKALSEEQRPVLPETKAPEEDTIIERERPVAEQEAHRASEDTLSGVETGIERPPTETAQQQPQTQEEPVPPLPAPVLEQEPMPAVSEARPLVEPETEERKKAETNEPEQAPEVLLQDVRHHEAATIEQPALQATHKAAAHTLTDKGKRRILYGAISLMLVAVLYGTGIFVKRDARKAEQETASKETVVQTPAPALKAPQRPRVFEAPANKPPDMDAYIVQHGDTLWDISKRFTGNPINYRHIAGENRIANPDLIFPGQKISLKKKK